MESNKEEKASSAVNQCCSEECKENTCKLASEAINIRSSIDVPLPDDILKEVVIDARDFAALHGAGMRYKDSYSADGITIAPFFLLPTPFPRRDFEKVYELQPLLNKLLHKVAHDFTFLEKCLRNTIKVDQFTRQLWEIYTTVRQEGVKQLVSLGLLRSDVMLTECTPGCCSLCLLPPYVMNQQVEINTIASGFGHLGPASALIHKYVLSKLGRQDLVKKLPDNTALEEICGSMSAAWHLYGRPLGTEEIALVYFRYGYDPAAYHGSEEWAARLLIERSLAIKCPTINYHLAGTKKVQQELAVEGVLLQFLNPEEAKRVSELFTGLYTLDLGEEGDKAVALALSAPDNYVLKPQREGGGNNLYGDDLKKTLETIGQSEDREAFILMERIKAPIMTNYLVRPQKDVELCNIISELGIFGAIMGTKNELMLNKTCGHMLRSKLSSNNEGGVASGNGALDSVLLVD